MVDALDALAEALDRDRTYLLNEAVAAPYRHQCRLSGEEKRRGPIDAQKTS
ncbi:MAG: hypothetical protein WA672_21865 [Candidatus Angelobacter sp.]